MKRLFVFLVLLAGCSEYPHTFKDSDKVVISGKFNGVVTNARDRVHKNEYVRVDGLTNGVFCKMSGFTTNY